MRIYFERSGGFMGIRLKTTVDTTALPAQEAQDYESTLEKIKFFELPADMTSTTGVDELIYRLTVSTLEQEHTVRTTDEAAPEEMRPLLQRLTYLARNPPPARNNQTNDPAAP